jgi:predicted unusual protein kinase regulating ubiquinone biosynthesis (AarF/ABC1/UbiB family)
MAARKVAAATASATFSIATSAYISRSAAADGQSALRLQQLHLSEEVIERYLFVPDEYDDRFLETAQKILKETGDEIEDSFDQFKTTTVFEDAKVGAIVAARFVDLLSRSAVALLDYKLHLLLDKSDQKLSDVHQRAAKSLYEACASHGGLLVKFGQYLSNNAGTMVPSEYIEALKPLQDSCAPLPIEIIRECVEEELRKLCIDRSENGGSLMEQVFQDFNPVPLGSASLAQVHAATLKDGRRVAIKVQRKHLGITTKADMIALHVLSRAIDRAFPGSGFEWML